MLACRGSLSQESRGSVDDLRRDSRWRPISSRQRRCCGFWMIRRSLDVHRSGCTFRFDLPMSTMAQKAAFGDRRTFSRHPLESGWSRSRGSGMMGRTATDPGRHSGDGRGIPFSLHGGWNLWPFRRGAPPPIGVPPEAASTISGQPVPAMSGGHPLHRQSPKSLGFGSTTSASPPEPTPVEEQADSLQADSGFSCHLPLGFHVPNLSPPDHVHGRRHQAAP